MRDDEPTDWSEMRATGKTENAGETEAIEETEDGGEKGTGGETTLDAARQRRAVRERYGNVATESASCCGDAASGCGAPTDRSRELGYSAADVDAVDPGANLGLGCGNPTAMGDLEPGDTVLDLGSGAGFDCFLAAREVGPDGRVIGVDMTPEMVERARENVEKNDVSNVEFRLGEIEHLPVPDESVDVILSNCVVNLSPDEPQVFREAYRVLKPGGRVAISDVVATGVLPADVRAGPESVAACVGGASPVADLEAAVIDSGFTHVSIEPRVEGDSGADCRDPDDRVVPAAIEGEKPARDSTAR